MKKIQFTAQKNTTLYKLLQEKFQKLGHNTINKMLRDKDVIVNGDRVKQNIDVNANDSIVVFYDENKERKFYEIFFEDQNIIILHKYREIETCDGSFNLQNLLKERGIIAYAAHRLDRNTEGLVIFAKTKELQKLLFDEFKSGNIIKNYYAVISGIAEGKKTLVDYLEKDSDQSKVTIKKQKTLNSVKITTKYSVLDCNKENNLSLLDVMIHGGKTHQIRAHLAFYNLPIIGDGKYGNYKQNAEFNKKYQMLFAYKLQFFAKNKSLIYLNDLCFCLDKNKFDLLCFNKK